MELEFDKEIDALLRNGRVSVGRSPAGGHPDADEIAAFAENAMPERSRALYLGHIADCERCRKILSYLIALNAEAEPEKAAAVPASLPAAADGPWYRKLFMFPNLAYVMGGLVLLFGGLIGISVFQGSMGSRDAVSQITESDSARGPMAPAEPQFQASANIANTTANTEANANSVPILPGAAANAASNAAVSAVTSPDRTAPAAETRQGAPDTIAAEAPADKPIQPAAAPPPAAVADDAPKELELPKGTEKARVLAEEDEKKKDAALVSRKREAVTLDGQAAQNVPRTQAGGVAKSTPGPTRDMQQTFPNRAENTYELRSRRVGGKDFQYKNGVWYDTEYRSQATTNVRRGTDDYRRLDSGIRSIAESLKGVVVVVSGGKAYRIQ